MTFAKKSKIKRYCSQSFKQAKLYITLAEWKWCWISQGKKITFDYLAPITQDQPLKGLFTEKFELVEDMRCRSKLIPQKFQGFM